MPAALPLIRPGVTAVATIGIRPTRAAELTNSRTNPPVPLPALSLESSTVLLPVPVAVRSIFWAETSPAMTFRVVRPPCPDPPAEPPPPLPDDVSARLDNERLPETRFSVVFAPRAFPPPPTPWPMADPPVPPTALPSMVMLFSDAARPDAMVSVVDPLNRPAVPPVPPKRPFPPEPPVADICAKMFPPPFERLMNIVAVPEFAAPPLPPNPSGVPLKSDALPPLPPNARPSTDRPLMLTAPVPAALPIVIVPAFAEPPLPATLVANGVETLPPFPPMALACTFV